MPVTSDTNFGGYQIWTVPVTGNYRIKCYGAGREVGMGAIIEANIYLQKGDKYTMLIGQRGDSEAAGCGGTFFTKGDDYQTSTAVIVAGGGGGYDVYQYNNPGPQQTVKDWLRASGNNGWDTFNPNLVSGFGGKYGFSFSGNNHNVDNGAESNHTPAGDNTPILGGGGGGGFSTRGFGNGEDVSDGQGGYIGYDGGEPFGSGGGYGGYIESGSNGGFGGGGAGVDSTMTPDPTEESTQTTDPARYGGGGGYNGGDGGSGTQFVLSQSSYTLPNRGGGGGSFISSECTNVNTYSGTGENYGTGNIGEGKIEISIIRDSYYDVKINGDIIANDISFNKLVIADSIIPGTNNITLGTVDSPIKSLFVSESSIYLVKDGVTKYKLSVQNNNFNFTKIKNDLNVPDLIPLDEFFDENRNIIGKNFKIFKDISSNSSIYLPGNIGVGKDPHVITGTPPNEQIVEGINTLDISGTLRCNVLEPQWKYNGGGPTDFTEDQNQHLTIRGKVLFQPYTRYTDANNGQFDSVVAINYDDMSAAIGQSGGGEKLIVDGNVLINGTITQNTSDQRIKKNISNVNNTKALEIVKNIPCKQYEYISKNIGTEYGFIAQDVKKYFPNAVTIRKNILIPSEYREINTNFTPVWFNKYKNKIEPNRIYNENGKEITKRKYKIIINDLSNNSMDSKYRFYLDKQLNGYVELKPIETPKTFLFDCELDYLFVFGKYINDFNALDKNQIFSLHHAAIQEIENNEDKTNSEIELLKKENNKLKKEIEILKNLAIKANQRINNL